MFFESIMSLWKKFLFSFSSSKIGVAFIKVTCVYLDPVIFKATGGRFTSVGPTVIPHVLLFTRGRQSGKHRQVQLVYTNIEGIVHIVASNFGGQRHPAWSYNLMADPVAKMQLTNDVISVKAELLNSDERSKVWSVLASNIPNYNIYKERTDRELKVYRLMPLV
jgi:deazaflavin-dependent oxidoreductase (nitroreductase family)